MALSVVSAPFQQVAMPALDLRRYVSALSGTEGVAGISDMIVSQRAAGANMSVDIAAGTAHIKGDDVAGQGNYLAYNDATYNLTGFTTPNATNPRIDRVVIRVRDAFHGGAANDVSFQILTGTATAGATLSNLNGAATVGNSQLLLANILLPASSSSIPNANIVDTRARLQTGGMQQIADWPLLSSLASVDFFNLPQSYSNLLITGFARGDTAATTINLLVRFNNDAGASNYLSEEVLASATTASAREQIGASSMRLADVAAASAPSGSFSPFVIWVPNYVDASNMTGVVGLFGTYTVFSSGGMTMRMTGGTWIPAAAVNEVTFIAGSGNFISGSRFTIYGIK